MGVPKFFTWIAQKYPEIIAEVVEERPLMIGSERVPVDCTQPNPNFQEFDNLYLDMNAIIHPCRTPEKRAVPKTEAEMFELICDYIDRIFAIVRPRRLVYMAIDGVAPSAKVKYSRRRRRNREKKASPTARTMTVENIRQYLEEEGLSAQTREPPSNAPFDMQQIKPGSDFMDELADELLYYIYQRLATDPAWANIQVILSDANVPGEGEHKIMDYIRAERKKPGYDSRTAHCVCSTDSDLIVLGLATHEPNFTIIRHEYGFEISDEKDLVKQSAPRPNVLLRKNGVPMVVSLGRQRPEEDEAAGELPVEKAKAFVWIRLEVLRQHLETDIAIPNLPFEYDFERVVDDWVFLCFFVGNDFLPHLPSLNIREGAIERLVELYVEHMRFSGGYLTEDGSVNLKRVQKILHSLGKLEDEIFKRRHVGCVVLERGKIQQLEHEKRIAHATQRTVIATRERSASITASVTEETTPKKRGRRRKKEPAPPAPFGILLRKEGVPTVLELKTEVRVREEQMTLRTEWERDKVIEESVFVENEKEITVVEKEDEQEAKSFKSKRQQRREKKRERKEKQKAEPLPISILMRRNGSPTIVELPKTKEGRLQSQRTKSVLLETTEKRWMVEVEICEEEGPPTTFSAEGDAIRLWEDGWKERYYREKFNVSADDVEFRRRVAKAYANGLCWIIRYYYKGADTEQWFYPYKYAPFASDFDLLHWR